MKKVILIVLLTFVGTNFCMQQSTSGKPMDVEVCGQELFSRMCRNLADQKGYIGTFTIKTRYLKEKIMLQNNKKKLFEVISISMFFKVVNTLPSQPVTSLPLTLSDGYSCIIDGQKKGSQFDLDLSE